MWSVYSCAPGAEQLLAKRPVVIVALHQPALLQHWHDAINEIHERIRGNGVGQIEAINTDVDPF